MNKTIRSIQDHGYHVDYQLSYSSNYGVCKKSIKATKGRFTIHGDSPIHVLHTIIDMEQEERRTI